MVTHDQETRGDIERLTRRGLLLVLALVGSFGIWSLTSELGGAVIATGSVVVDAGIQRVQHPTGGAVATLMVAEGTAVRAGDVLLTLDATKARSDLALIEGALNAELLRETRLIAERDGRDAITVSAELATRLAEEPLAGVYSGEQKLFDSRRSTLEGERAQLQEQIVQLNEQVRGLEAQMEATQRQLAIADDEFTRVIQLQSQGLVSLQRVTSLQREQVQLEGTRGELIASIANARARISELEIASLQREERFLADVLAELQASQVKIAELRERKSASQEALQRLNIIAPQSGTVHQLSVRTIGGVVGAGETILQIIPSEGELGIQARIPPETIDQVSVGSPVLVRFVAANQRRMPLFDGVVRRLSADLVQERVTQLAYYIATIDILDRHGAEEAGAQWIPGSPVEVYVQTGSRSPMEYLMGPLVEQVQRTFTER